MQIQELHEPQNPGKAWQNLWMLMLTLPFLPRNSLKTKNLKNQINNSVHKLQPFYDSNMEQQLMKTP